MTYLPFFQFLVISILNTLVYANVSETHRLNEMHAITNPNLNIEFFNDDIRHRASNLSTLSGMAVQMIY